MSWSSGKPILGRLPGVQGRYNDDPITAALVGFWDEFYVGLRQKSDYVGSVQIDPMLCDPEWLDFLAPLLGWDSLHWDANYPTEGKRLLLSNSFKGVRIWEGKGSARIMMFVLSSIGIRNYVEDDADFLIDISEVGDPIGEDPWSFTVYLPPEYQGTSTERKVRQIVELFGPAYCEWQIVWDSERFRIFEALSTYDSVGLLTETGELIIGEF